MVAGPVVRASGGGPWWPGGNGSTGASGSGSATPGPSWGSSRPASFDLVIADLFTGARTPAHATTVEFAADAAAALSPAGIFAANMGDGPPLAHARARVATVRAVFPHACLIADPGVMRGRRFGNLVLAASRKELPLGALAGRAAGDPFPGRVLGGGELDRFAAGARPVVDAEAEASPAPPLDLFDVRW